MQRWYFSSFLLVNPALVILGCLGLFVRCTVLEKTAHATGMATEEKQAPVPDFIERSRPPKLEYHPLYITQERRHRGSKNPSSDTIETFKNLEQDLEQQRNRIKNP